MHIDDEVIAQLGRLKAISTTDAEEIRAETVDYAKASKLISIITRRSNYSYNIFQMVLKSTLQTTAAGFLSEGKHYCVISQLMILDRCNRRQYAKEHNVGKRLIQVTVLS